MNNIAIKFALPQFFAVIVILASLALLFSANFFYVQPNPAEHYRLTPLFPTDAHPSITFTDSIIASPILDTSTGKPLVIAPSSNGLVAALDAETGVLVWQINVPTPEGHLAHLISTPLIIGDKLIIIYQCWEKGLRTSHRMAVIDLLKQRLDPDFPVLVLNAEKPSADGLSTIKFNPPTAFSHAALKYAPKPDSAGSFIYAAFGNSGDEQPYHGWLFEIDLEAWHDSSFAAADQAAKPVISSVLLTTPESDCPVTREYGNQEMVCGGGIWTPAGPQIYPSHDSYEIIVPTGNGQTDLNRHDYANALMRVKPGLVFDAACDAKLCAKFNPVDPDHACLASCQNLFIPRLPKGSTPLKPASGECDGKSFYECLAWMDYDLGGSAPTKVNMANGLSVLVQPSKDGSVYLLDADHLGTQYDRLQIVDLCGTLVDQCKFDWMGMIVTQAVAQTIDDTPVVVIPTFVADKTHPAGLVALKVVLENGQPKFKHFWQFPDPKSLEALSTFRSHPSLPVLAKPDKNNDASVWVVDIGRQGTLYGIRIKDGTLVAKQSLKGAGRQISSPLVSNNHIYVASIMPGTNKAMLEGFRIDQAED
ncbi:MAG: hypothetical protein NTV43_00690 [Methylococcales bacterium]|nr:hypothetical protein [Methylococcales bacterium]